MAWRAQHWWYIRFFRPDKPFISIFAGHQFVVGGRMKSSGISGSSLKMMVWRSSDFSKAFRFGKLHGNDREVAGGKYSGFHHGVHWH